MIRVLTFTIFCGVATVAHAQDAPDPQDSTTHESVSFLKALGHDVTNLASSQTLLILGIGGAGAFAVSPADSR